MPAYIQVALPLPINHTFTYRCPDELVLKARPGCRAVVPFARRAQTGVIVEDPATEIHPGNILNVIDLPDPEPLLSAELLELTRWISEYYLCAWGEALKAALPAGHLLEGSRLVRLLTDAETVAQELNSTEQRIIEILKHDGARSPDYLTQKLRLSSVIKPLRRLEERGFIQIDELVPEVTLEVQYQEQITIGERQSRAELLARAALIERKAPKQAAILRLVAQQETTIPTADLLRETAATRNTLNSLFKTGLLQSHKVQVKKYPILEALSLRDVGPLPEPNAAQIQAIEAINASAESDKYKAFLLYGVTGSGKTLVYQKTIEQVIQRGGQALVLIPEISLTPQMVGRFRSLFGDRIALQHSALSSSERSSVWQGIRAGDFDVVIGARSAVFAPLKRLKLVVVDEEGDTSFKQNEPNPRYHARDVALVRARSLGATVVLGSATPSIETFFNAQQGRYALLQLPERVDGVPLPKIKFVEPPYNRNKVIGFALRRALEDRMQRGEQAILLRNRRGFFTFVFCPHCDYIAQCRHCELTLTYHRPEHILRCHVCGQQTAPPRNCPQCRHELKYTGSGTQRVEDELNQILPKQEIARLDQDTTSRHRSHQRILQKFAKGENAILLGTKMVARGHDYPGVTLVGVLSADAELTFPDFRCDERTFSLLLQVAGRAGRASKDDNPGEVLIQTWMPGHPVLKLVKNADYNAFYEREIKLRHNLNYPPWGWVVFFVFSALDQQKAQSGATEFVSQAKEMLPEGEWLGPVPAFRAKLKDHYRFQAILKAGIAQRRINSKLHQGLRLLVEQMRPNLPVGVQMTVDVDPISLL